MVEEFRRIKGYEDYEVSNLGDVYSFKRNKRMKLKPNLKKGSTGYLEVVLWKINKGTTKLVHRLVAHSFIPNKEKKREVNHIDCNKKNNIVFNLEWVTHKENHKHASENGLKVKGENDVQSKLTEREVMSIRKEYSEGKTSHRKLAKKYSVNHTLIGFIVRRVYWKHI